MGRFLNPKAVRASSEGKARGTSLRETPPAMRGEGVPAGGGGSTTLGEVLVETGPRGPSNNGGSQDRRLTSGGARKRAPWQPQAEPSELAASDATAAGSSRPLMVRVGNIALFLYLISGELNDLSHHFFGVNAYVSWVSQILLAIALVSSGSLLRAWNLRVGKLWILLLVLMIASVPLSEWPGRSFHSVIDYFMRSTLIFFAVCAFVVDAQTLKTAILGEVVNGWLVLVSCMTMGGAAPGGDRFALLDSYFYQGANDLAMTLTIAAGFFLYWTVQSNFFKVALGGVSLLSAIYFIMKTGSRGGFLALAILLAASVIFSVRYRWRIVPMLLLAPGLLLFVPGDLTHRLGFIALDSSKAHATTGDEGASLFSQQEREYMFWRSVHLMVTHPILGVGMECFRDTLNREDKEKHEHTVSLGTHNSYTQIGCECGIPALLVYLSIMFISLWRTYRVFREASGKPGLEPFAAAALCLVSVMTGLSAAMFFYHSAYSPVVPILTGLMAGLGQAFHREMAALEAPAAA
jgi:O-antigen ligase